MVVRGLKRYVAIAWPALLLVVAMFVSAPSGVPAQERPCSDAASCLRAARDELALVLPDRSRVRALLYAACQSRGGACEDGADALLDSNQGAWATDLAVGLLTAACRVGDGGACHMLGEMYRTGRGVRVDVKRSEAEYRAACAAGDCRRRDHLERERAEQEARANEAARRQEEERLARERAERDARQRQEREFAQQVTRCGEGRWDDCAKVAERWYLQADPAVVAQEESAWAYERLREGCNRKHGPSCHVLGEMHRLGRGNAERDDGLSKRLLLVACEAGDCRGTERLTGPMIRVRAGRFRMGSPSNEEGRNDDENQVDVRLTRDFLLGRFEVTQDLYKTVMGANPSNFAGCLDCPVERVSWFDAVRFTKLLNDQLGLPVCYDDGYRLVGGATVYDCQGFRLPTEAEWEYAARAGTKGARYGALDSVAWHDGNSGGRPQPVGLKQANAWGFHDMLGNVWEWTDTWDQDTSSGGTDPVGPTSGSDRVLRGGSWNSSAQNARAANRSSYSPGDQDYDIGFRLARTAP